MNFNLNDQYNLFIFKHFVALPVKYSAVAHHQFNMFVSLFPMWHLLTKIVAVVFVSVIVFFCVCFYFYFLSCQGCGYYKFKDKFVILHSIGIIFIKSKDEL